MTAAQVEKLETLELRPFTTVREVEDHVDFVEFVMDSPAVGPAVYLMDREGRLVTT